jgi:tetratricopeptide (TPR) repeat protein
MLMPLAIVCVAAGTALAADAPKPQAIQGMLQSAHRALNQKQPSQAAEICQQVLAIPSASAAQKIDAYQILVDIPRRAKDRQAALAAAVKMAAGLPDSVDAQVRSENLQGDLNFEMGHKAEAITHFTAVAQKTDNPKVRQNANMRIAAIHAGENRTDEALAAYEQAFTDSPGVSDGWHEAQKSIVGLLRKSGRLDEALKAARICYDASPNASSIAQSCSLIAGILKDIDKNTTRANAFLAFQEFGPNGKDGIAGNADDLTNPLASVGYPSYPAREKAFAKARESMGDDAAASRLRALTFLYSAHPDEALKHMAEYFRRSHLEAYPMQAVVNDMMALGVKPLRGHATGLKPFYEFIRFGPAGPDGQANTADDLKDPFAALGLQPVKPSEDGGLAPPPAKDRAALVELERSFEAIVATEHDDHQLRMALLSALERIHDSLCDWGMPGQRDWYLSLVNDSFSNEYVCFSVLHSGEAAARGSDLHFGGVGAYWKKVDEMLQAEGRKLSEQPQQLVGRYRGTVDLLKDPVVLHPSLPPLK